MSFIKHVTCITLIVTISCSSMHLTKERWKEFIQDKKTLIQIGKEYLPNDWQNNNLIAKYQQLADKEDDQLTEFFGTPIMQNEIIYLYHAVYTKPEFLAARKNALANINGEKAWDALRVKNGELLRGIAEGLHGITSKQPTADCYLATHANSNDKIINTELAKSFLLYHMRDFQEEKTGKKCPPIDFRKYLKPLESSK